MSNSIHIKSGSFYLISGSTHITSSITGSEYIASVQLDPNDPTSFIISGSNDSSSIYVSSSGKMGFGTTDPLVAFDVRADEFQIQKTSKRQGVRVNEEGNIESFNSETDAAATGSEFILTYARGGKSKMTSQFLQTQLGVGSDEIAGAGGATAYFDTLDPRTQEKLLFLLEKESGLIDVSTVGDTLGSIRWVAASGSTEAFDKRVAGEAGSIKMQVASADATGVTGKLSINLPADPNAVSQQLYLINGATQKHEFSGSGGFEFMGNVTATRFYGDGANLTNLPAASVPAGTISSSLQTFTALTSSGDISASGTVTAASATFTTANVNAGNVTANITVGAEQTLELREAGTINIANNSISGDAINGGTIDTITITNLTTSINGGSF